MSMQSALSLASRPAISIMPPMGHVGTNFNKVAPILTALLILQNLPTVEAVDRSKIELGLISLGTAAFMFMLPVNTIPAACVMVAPETALAVGLALKGTFVATSTVIGFNSLTEGLGLAPQRP